MSDTNGNSNGKKKYASIAETTYIKVRVFADPERVQIPIWEKGQDTGKKKDALRVKFFKETRNTRARDHAVEVTVDLTYRPWLAKIRKGDVIAAVKGFEDVRLYDSKGKNAHNGVDLSTEIRNPNVFEMLTDLRDREDSAQPTVATQATEAPAPTGSFFGD